MGAGAPGRRALPAAGGAPQLPRPDRAGRPQVPPTWRARPPPGYAAGRGRPAGRARTSRKLRGRPTWRGPPAAVPAARGGCGRVPRRPGRARGNRPREPAEGGRAGPGGPGGGARDPGPGRRAARSGETPAPGVLGRSPPPAGFPWIFGAPRGLPRDPTGRFGPPGVEARAGLARGQGGGTHPSRRICAAAWPSRAGVSPSRSRWARSWVVAASRSSPTRVPAWGETGVRPQGKGASPLANFYASAELRSGAPSFFSKKLSGAWGPPRTPHCQGGPRPSDGVSCFSCWDHVGLEVRGHLPAPLPGSGGSLVLDSRRGTA